MLMNATVVIANRINTFFDGWSEGDSYYLSINIDDLFLEGDKDLEDKIDEILINTESVESFEIKCGELILEINMFVLQREFDARMQEWSREKQLQNQEYYRSVI